MGKVLLERGVSVDGYVAGPDVSVEAHGARGLPLPPRAFSMPRSR